MTMTVPRVLDGDVAVVTGAAQGNGAAIASGLAAAGATVLLCDVNEAGAKTQADRIVKDGGRAQGYVLDVSDRAACHTFAEVAEADFGKVSILVNNAGITRRTAPEDPAFLDDLDAQVAINVNGSANMIVALLDQLKERAGRVVNVGSIASFVAYRNSASYAASKGAVLQMTKAFACDLAAEGVRVNGVAPGVIATPMTEGTRANADAMSRFMSHTPMGRVGAPDELVGPVIFLASPMSSYVTGVMLPVDGGYLTN
ncbi:SDR family NAD(P)-dependent oxidoreductase [Tranquillimonas alkanivorans]|uniref:NAD(P)-dependent dehydrogenase, short-chain alcohol dehydrogenase family n=1 Tax=Tranquillimonas alkanivorans TaxID=441119 RepID=A0A1I5W9M2_9RHOB|nr:SDR family oxidoreductase [Tranquillimonas alkanivorans]SFQ16389.1 NAD(P)-dependent dehydrogenase, short-chain alcohol dehydrogenase family [Tranquillimonas alkanivorans]